MARGPRSHILPLDDLCLHLEVLCLGLVLALQLLQRRRLVARGRACVCVRADVGETGARLVRPEVSLRTNFTPPGAEEAHYQDDGQERFSASCASIPRHALFCTVPGVRYLVSLRRDHGGPQRLLPRLCDAALANQLCVQEPKPWEGLV